MIAHRIAARWLRGVALCCLLVAGQGHALGLGELTLHSALHQPLHAEVALQLASHERLEDVSARLADREAYRRAALVRPDFLAQLSFRPERNAAGQAVIRISSRDVVREPVLELLLDVRWHDGRLQRQYPMLFELPTKFVAPVVTPGVIVEFASAADAAGASTAQAPAARAGSYGPVQRGEILGEIARRLKPVGVSTEQMSVALYKANPHAFLEGNINRLRWGTTLFMPSEADMNAMSRGEAGRFIQAQYNEWKGQRSMAVATAPVSSAVEADAQAQPAAPPATTQLQILAPSPSPADAMVDELHQRLSDVQRINQAVQAENEELRAKLAELEAQTRLLAERLLAVAPEAEAEIGARVAPAPERMPDKGRELVGDAPAGLQLAGIQPPPVWWREWLWWLVGLAISVMLGVAMLGRVIWRHYHDEQYRGFEQALREDELAKERARLARRAQTKRRFS